MAELNSTKITPQLSHSSFWDIDLNGLDFDRYADFTIIRVFEKGTLEDIDQITKYYGKARIINSITHATSLQPRAIALGQKIFNLSLNQFICSRPSPQVTNYSQ